MTVDESGTRTPTEDEVPLREAADLVGVSVHALRKAVRAGRLTSRVERGPYGDEHRVSLAEARDVMARPRAPRPAPASPTSAAAPAPVGDYLPVPVDEWRRVMAQIGNLHQAGQDLAEARERAARAEERETFLRERLEELRHRLEAAEQATRDVDEPRTFLGFRRRRTRDPRREGAAPSTRDTA